MEKKKQEAVDREQELAATKIQSRIRGKQARREQCSEAGLSRLKPTCALYSVVSRIGSKVLCGFRVWGVQVFRGFRVAAMDRTWSLGFQTLFPNNQG